MVVDLGRNVSCGELIDSLDMNTPVARLTKSGRGVEGEIILSPGGASRL
jgi:hypothetical protein